MCFFFLLISTIGHVCVREERGREREEGNENGQGDVNSLLSCMVQIFSACVCACACMCACLLLHLVYSSFISVLEFNFYVVKPNDICFFPIILFFAFISKTEVRKL